MTAYDPRRWLNRGPVGFDPLAVPGERRLEGREPAGPGGGEGRFCPHCGKELR